MYLCTCSCRFNMHMKVYNDIQKVYNVCAYTYIYIYICTFLCVCSTKWIFSNQALSDIVILYFISSRRGCTVSPVLSCLRLCDQSRGAPDFPQLHGINDTMKWGLRCPRLEQLTGFHQFTGIGSYAQPFLIAFGCFTHLFFFNSLKNDMFLLYNLSPPGNRPRKILSLLYPLGKEPCFYMFLPYSDPGPEVIDACSASQTARRGFVAKSWRWHSEVT